MINFYPSERKTYSQNGEDGVIAAIFNLIGTKNKFFVEFGVGGGGECNTRLLREKGWDGLWMDIDQQDDPMVKQETISNENINHLLDKYAVPQEFDLLSIDIDGQDYWVWKEIIRRPRVVIIEYNGYLPTDSRLVVKRDPDFRWAKDNYFGSGIEALRLLGIQKGYRMVYVDFQLVNAFFIRQELVEKYEFDYRLVKRTDIIKPSQKEWVVDVA